jgi:hypothetical protein
MASASILLIDCARAGDRDQSQHHDGENPPNDVRIAKRTSVSSH